MRKTKIFQSLVATALLGLAASQASAALITSRAALGGNDFIDWAQLGGVGVGVSSPANVISDLGLSAVATNAAGNFFRLNQGSGWSGNFAVGDALLWTNNTAGPISLDFGSGISAAGAQIQQNLFGSFTAVISAYDSFNNLLESYQVVGDSTPNGDNSAIFIGISRGAADIDRIDFSVLGGFDFAINQVTLLADGGNNGTVPVPASLALVGAGLLALSATQRRRQR